MWSSYSKMLHIVYKSSYRVTNAHPISTHQLRGIDGEFIPFDDAIALSDNELVESAIVEKASSCGEDMKVTHYTISKFDVNPRNKWLLVKGFIWTSTARHFFYNPVQDVYFQRVIIIVPKNVPFEVPRNPYSNTFDVCGEGGQVQSAQDVVLSQQYVFSVQEQEQTFKSSSSLDLRKLCIKIAETLHVGYDDMRTETGAYNGFAYTVSDVDTSFAYAKRDYHPGQKELELTRALDSLGSLEDLAKCYTWNGNCCIVDFEKLRRVWCIQLRIVSQVNDW